MPSTKALSQYVLAFMTTTAFVAFGGTISIPTDFTGRFIYETDSNMLGQTFRVPDPSTENILNSVTINLFGGPGDADESPPTFNYEVQVFAFDPIALAPTGAALYASGRRSGPLACQSLILSRLQV